ncbi:MAG: hypothetical protein ABJF90_11545 [Lentilitoribacter sp.]
MKISRDDIPQLGGTDSLTDWHGTAVRKISYLFGFSHQHVSFTQPVSVTTGEISEQ